MYWGNKRSADRFVLGHRLGPASNANSAPLCRFLGAPSSLAQTSSWLRRTALISCNGIRQQQKLNIDNLMFYGYKTKLWSFCFAMTSWPSCTSFRPQIAPHVGTVACLLVCEAIDGLFEVPSLFGRRRTLVHTVSCGARAKRFALLSNTLHMSISVRPWR